MRLRRAVGRTARSTTALPCGAAQIVRTSLIKYSESTQLGESGGDLPAARSVLTAAACTYVAAALAALIDAARWAGVLRF
ncbi:MAG: hypothetical protein E6G97_20650 [Alphaproteobacteria bacterium]|nr:MAG: hypothetical protein E6G97_20650 [Alphaproteobacteria bacterium]